MVEAPSIGYGVLLAALLFVLLFAAFSYCCWSKWRRGGGTKCLQQCDERERIVLKKGETLVGRGDLIHRGAECAARGVEGAIATHAYCDGDGDGEAGVNEHIMRKGKPTSGHHAALRLDYWAAASPFLSAESSRTPPPTTVVMEYSGHEGVMLQHEDRYSSYL